MQYFTIIGAGPIGLYYAARLAKIKSETGLPISIIVIDPRAPNYCRERIVSNNAISKIISLFDINIPTTKEIPPEAMYINDFEKALYQYCVHHNVTFKKGTFNQLHPLGLYYNDTDSGRTEKINCDIVIDCSGANRVVLKDTNRFLEDEFFKIRRLGHNPITHHFSSYLTINAEEESKLKTGSKTDPLLQAKVISLLRNKYSWPHFSFPEMDIRSTKRENGDFNYFIYYEAPDNLNQSDKKIQIDYLTDLFKLKYCSEDITLPSHTPLHFEVDPHFVETPFYQGGDLLPAIFPGGDCQIEPDYRVGIGIESGIDRANLLMDSIRFNRSGLELNLEAYTLTSAQYLSYHASIVARRYEMRLNNIQNFSLTRALTLFTQAATSIKNADDSCLLAKELKSLGNMFYKQQKYACALESYLIGIQLYKRLKEPAINEMVTLYSNACQAALLIGHFKQCLDLANEGLVSYPKRDGNSPPIFFKLLFRKATSIIHLLNSLELTAEKALTNKLLLALFDTHTLMIANSSVSNQSVILQIQKQIDRNAEKYNFSQAPLRSEQYKDLPRI
jgi:tetratricopeptide (TPR) repeat protein